MVLVLLLDENTYHNIQSGLWLSKAVLIYVVVVRLTVTAIEPDYTYCEYRTTLIRTIFCLHDTSDVFHLNHHFFYSILQNVHSRNSTPLCSKYEFVFDVPR